MRKPPAPVCSSCAIWPPLGAALTALTRARYAAVWKRRISASLASRGGSGTSAPGGTATATSEAKRRLVSGLSWLGRGSKNGADDSPPLLCHANSSCHSHAVRRSGGGEEVDMMRAGTLDAPPLASEK